MFERAVEDMVVGILIVVRRVWIDIMPCVSGAQISEDIWRCKQRW
jgi:hypothetical protein